MYLIVYRAIAGAVIAVVTASWFYPTAAAQQTLLLATGVLFLLWLAIESALTYSELSEPSQRGIGYMVDIILAGILIYATGGINSPFSLLLGLIIIASGTHAYRMLPLLTTIVTCVTYLIAVYGEATFVSYTLPDAQQALHILFQASTLMLVGGVMAYIARRHASLRASSDKAVRQHRQLKDLHDRIMLSMREGVIVLDNQLQASDMNDAARELLGEYCIEQLIENSALNDFFQTSKASMFQTEQRLNDITLLLAVTRLSADEDAAWLLTLVDISDLRTLEHQLIQKEKLAAMGQMSAMLAHEIRNPIQTMTQGLEIMAANKSVGVDIHGIIHDEMLRLNRLVSTMLDYSKPLLPNKLPILMPQLLQAAVNKVEMVEQGVIDWSCEVNELFIDGDHFRLVLDNLLSNALANSPDGSKVNVCLGAEEHSWCLFVSNQGEIPDVLRGSLFEPFTTGRSRGIGLGLATVKQVCDVNGWTVHLESSTGQTCFAVSGPILTDKVLSDATDQMIDTRERQHG
ncbi:two-component system, NtrC family, sensor histidine kinase PilS [Mariprofundus micogutta]|uniref:histidine kinase n=1 Tax=Mariprofundus micogutta TaxID=1921010 RepID=A0A1L8CPQ6_9PROT|nr:ATP-binding protein [Mariprofundus micogutta]GAV20864.1 two-component system, NtrC family, sensor histidine kinase PilS [Mariprofundus micogutta]